MQTQTSNALHNVIIEAGGKDRPSMLAPGNYVQWKSRIKRYIDTKPNHELIHYCLQNPPYEYKWTDKDVPVAEGSTETTTKRYMENYKNVSQDIHDQLNSEAEAVQIILTGIDNDIYSIVDACPNACEMWKAIERLKQGYIVDSKPEMDPDEGDRDDEKSKGDSIDYPTSRGDDDADDDDDDLAEDDADDEDKEESSDSEEEEEEHLALTVPAPALHSLISASEDSDQTEPFEEGETAATSPPSAYRITARISVRPHISMPFPSDSEVERLLAIPTPPLSPVSSTSYPLPPFLMPLPIFTPLLPPPPIILPRTRASMVLMRSAAPSTFILAPLPRTPPIRTPPLLPIPVPTSSFPLPLLLPSTSCREGIPKADMPRRKKAHFTTPTGKYEVGESSAAAAARQIRPTLTVDDNRRAKDRLIGRLRRERRYFHTLSTTYAQEECTYKDYLNRGPLKFKGTEGVICLTQWFERTESMSSISNCTVKNQVKFASCTLIESALTWLNSHMRAVIQEVIYAMPWKTLRQMMTAKYCRRGEVKKLEVELWNLKVKGTDITSYTLRFQELALLCGRMFLEESGEIERYVGGLPEMLRGNVMSYEPKSMQKAIEFANDQMDQNLLGIADRQAEAEQLTPTTITTTTTRGPHRHIKEFPLALSVELKAGNGNVVAKAYGVGTAGGNPDANVLTELGSFNVIIGMDWLTTYHAVIMCDEKIIRVPFGNETLIIRCDGSNNETQLNIISCTKTRKYLLKGYPVFLANITTKTIKDKSKEKRLENVLIVRDFSEVFPEDLPGLPPTRHVEFQIDLIPGVVPVAQAPYRLA
nr:reverse transcriptase domain-containing protein [Tanacetum cinerariifolium]